MIKVIIDGKIVAGDIKLAENFVTDEYAIFLLSNGRETVENNPVYENQFHREALLKVHGMLRNPKATVHTSNPQIMTLYEQFDGPKPNVEYENPVPLHTI